jgi:simple sugar transport system ATP-binding protein
MVGREVQMRLARPPAQAGDVVLSAQGLRLAGPHGLAVLHDVSFDVRAGEIVGLAGVAGNGQTELVDVLVGLTQPDQGRILLEGRDVTHEPILARRKQGFAYIPEDRYRRGLAAEATVAENLALGFHRRAPLAQGGLLRPNELRRWAAGLAEDYDIRLSDPGEAAANLSGGNLQKMVVAREFSRPARFILADQPTRGVDIAATDFIHRKLIERRNAGDAILLISADLDEILALSDRVLVICTGTLQADLPAAEADEHEIGLLMADLAESAPAGPDGGGPGGPT